MKIDLKKSQICPILYQSGIILAESATPVSRSAREGAGQTVSGSTPTAICLLTARGDTSVSRVSD